MLPKNSLKCLGYNLRESKEPIWIANWSKTSQLTSLNGDFSKHNQKRKTIMEAGTRKGLAKQLVEIYCQPRAWMFHGLQGTGKIIDWFMCRLP